MALSQRDYENFAQEVATAFVENKTPLSESITKIAQENEFNPDQVKRLVEMANTQTFLKLFNSPDGKEKNIDFDVADPSAILSDYYSPGSGSSGKNITITKVTISKMPNDPFEFESDCPDMMRSTRHGVLPDFQEEAAAPARGPQRHMIVMQLRKVASALEGKIYETEQEYQSGLDKLASDFSKLYGPDYAEFEKVALCHYGDVVTPILNDVRAMVRWTKPMFDLEKVASTRIMLDTNTPEFQVFDQMVSHKKDQVKYAKAVKVARSKLKELSNESK